MRSLPNYGYFKFLSLYANTLILIIEISIDFPPISLLNFLIQLYYGMSKNNSNWQRSSCEDAKYHIQRTRGYLVL